MSLPVKTGLPDNLELSANWTVRFTAIDAATGATVTSVVVSKAAITVADVGAAEFDYGPFMLVPGPAA